LRKTSIVQQKKGGGAYWVNHTKKRGRGKKHAHVSRGRFEPISKREKKGGKQTRRMREEDPAKGRGARTTWKNQ